MKGKITIYTDGAARGNPGPAGWAAVFLEGGEIFREIGGHMEHATNNQMELRAVIEALKYAKKEKIAAVVRIIADSEYVVKGITLWIHDWQKKGWRNAAKKPVKNRELWEELYELDRGIKPKWDYVRGHHTDKYNIRADEIATSFADNEPVKLKK